MINEQRISWKSPNESIDSSFDLELNEIEKLVIRKKDKHLTRSNYAGECIIHSKSGSEFRLNKNSGINLSRFFLELERSGISIEQNHV